MSSNFEETFCQLEATDSWNEFFQRIKNSASMKMLDKDCKISRLPENMKKNKFRDIVPFDFNRVALLQKEVHSDNGNDGEDLTSDYVNASLVELANQAYVVTQHPSKGGASIFWTMVWQQNCRLVIQIGQDGRTEEYYPQSSGQFCTTDENSSIIFTISLLERLEFDGFIVRKLRTFNNETCENREVMHIQYWSWPDKSVPSCTESFFSFLAMSRSLMQQHCRYGSNIISNKGPPVIHCSAGAGRSGTLCLIDIAISILEKSKGSLDGVDMLDLTERLRCQRMGMVHSWKQLRFAWEILMDAAERLQEVEHASCLLDSHYLTREDTEHSCPNLSDRDSFLESENNNDNESQAVKQSDWDDEEDDDLDQEVDEVIYSRSPDGSRDIIDRISDESESEFKDGEKIRHRNWMRRQANQSAVSVDANAYLSRADMLRQRSQRTRAQIVELDRHMRQNQLKRHRLLASLGLIRGSGSQSGSSTSSSTSLTELANNLQGYQSKAVATYRSVILVTASAVLVVGVYFCFLHFLSPHN